MTTPATAQTVNIHTPWPGRCEPCDHTPCKLVRTAQHTPGPWYASASTENGITVHRDSTGTLLATIRALDVDGAGAANARLIAAAPALLAALEDVSRAYQQMFDVMPVAFQTYADIVDDAIRAAKGKSA